MRKVEDRVINFIHNQYHHLYHVVASDMSANQVEEEIGKLIGTIGKTMIREAQRGTLGKYVVRLLKDEKINNFKGATRYYMRWWFIFIYRVDCTTDYNQLTRRINSDV